MSPLGQLMCISPLRLTTVSTCTCTLIFHHYYRDDGIPDWMQVMSNNNIFWLAFLRAVRSGMNGGSLLIRRRKSNELKAKVRERVHNKSILAALLQRSKRKGSKPLRTHTAVIWICTQLCVNGNNRGIFSFIEILSFYLCACERPHCGLCSSVKDPCVSLIWNIPEPECSPLFPVSLLLTQKLILPAFTVIS